MNEDERLARCPRRSERFIIMQPVAVDIGILADNASTPEIEVDGWSSIQSG